MMSAERRRTARRRAILATGFHPATRLALLHPEWVYGCGDCARAVQVNGGNRWYWKCLKQGITHGPGTDIRVSWPACRALRIAA